jgi:chloramphenicol 3-O phosphotransferase
LNRTTRIVFLNGVGSVGKSSIATELQAIMAEPFLHVQMDAFLDMLPQGYENHPDSFTYETVHEGGKPVVIIGSGPVGERLMRGMRQAIASMAGQGNNMIVDEVMQASEWTEYAGLLSSFEVSLVGLFAPLEVLEARELQRGDRLIGLARWQYGRIHKGMRYDLEVDTSDATPNECARLIKHKLKL